MGEKYPLKEVVFRQVKTVQAVDNPGYTGDYYQVSGNSCAFRVPDIGDFFVSNGRQVEYSVLPGADPEWVQLWLNSQVLVALLHQRGIINFHASSIIFQEKGVMILGETGCGKSSLTASLIREGARFLSDDLTPVVFRENKPFIMPLSRPVKLRDDAIAQLKIPPPELRDAEKGTGKKYLKTGTRFVDDYPLHNVFILEKGDVDTVEFVTPTPAEKFSLLRSEICSWDMLAGMPATEADYLDQVLRIVQQVKAIKIVRPEKISIPLLHVAVIDYLEMNT